MTDTTKAVAEALKPFLYDMNGPDLHIRAAKAAIAAMTPEAAPKRKPEIINKAALDQAYAARKKYRANTPITLYSIEGEDTVFIAAYLEAAPKREPGPKRRNYKVLGDRCPECGDNLIHNNKGVECGALGCTYHLPGSEPYDSSFDPPASLSDFFTGTGEPMPVDRPDLRGETPNTMASGAVKWPKGCRWPDNRKFTFADDPGKHDPCYIVMPCGSMLPLNHYNDDDTDITRAHFIVAACNHYLRPAGPVSLEMVLKDNEFCNQIGDPYSPRRSWHKDVVTAVLDAAGIPHVEAWTSVADRLPPVDMVVSGTVRGYSFPIPISVAFLDKDGVARWRIWPGTLKLLPDTLSSSEVTYWREMEALPQAKGEQDD